MCGFLSKGNGGTQCYLIYATKFRLNDCCDDRTGVNRNSVRRTTHLAAVCLRGPIGESIQTSTQKSRFVGPYDQMLKLDYIPFDSYSLSDFCAGQRSELRRRPWDVLTAHRLRIYSLESVRASMPLGLGARIHWRKLICH